MEKKKLSNKENDTIGREEYEKEFLEYIHPKRIGYERILFEEYYDRIKSILGGENPPPYDLDIQPTSRCNSKCDHCWSRRLNYKNLEEKLTTKKAMKKIINEVLNFKKDGFIIEKIKFCGSTGEPLVNPLTLYAIDKIDGARYLRLFTNGILLAENKDNKEFLETLSKLSSMDVSLDVASSSKLWEIKKVPKNIKLEDILRGMNKIRNLSKKNIDMKTSYVITNKNYKDIVNFARRVKEYDAANTIRYKIDLIDRSVSVNHGEEIVNLIKEARFYEDKNFKITPLHSDEEIKKENDSYFTIKNSKLRCYTSRIWSCIGSDGCLYPCGHIVSADTENFGSVLENSFEEIWEGEKRMSLLKNLPAIRCDICSPFSRTANEIITGISSWPMQELDRLYKKYIKKESV